MDQNGDFVIFFLASRVGFPFYIRRAASLVLIFLNTSSFVSIWYQSELRVYL